MSTLDDLIIVEKACDSHNQNEDSPKQLHEDKVDDEDVASENEQQDEETKEKKYKYGLVYLSYIPLGMNVKSLREFMSSFGEVGRIYLQPENEIERSKMKRHKHRTYCEGWVEFKKKRVAKAVAKALDKTSTSDGQIWSVKYLHRFKWTHLNEQLAYDKASRDQRRRFEMSQAKKQSDFYQKMTERSKMMRKHKMRADGEQKGTAFRWKQNKPTSCGEELQATVDDDLLTNIFRKVN